MSVATIKSTQITNRDASPEVLNNASVASGAVIEAVGVCAVGATDTTGSTYRFLSIPSNARISSVQLWSDASAGANMTLSMDLYDTTANAGAIVKSGFFKSSLDPSTRFAATDATFTASGAGTNLMSGAEKMVWQNLSGLSSDPSKWYDVVATSGANNTTTGCNLICKVAYSV